MQKPISRNKRPVTSSKRRAVSLGLVVGCAFAAYLGFLAYRHFDSLKAKALEAKTYFTSPEDKSYEIAHATLGSAALTVLIADTEAKRELGLSGHSPLSFEQGMLFEFPAPGKHGFWMKDMGFPLDIIWFDAQMRVIYIQARVSPDTFPQVLLPPSEDSKVLEVKAGFVDKFHVSLGSELVVYK